MKPDGLESRNERVDFRDCHCGCFARRNDKTQTEQTLRPFESSMLEVAKSNMLGCPTHLRISMKPDSGTTPRTTSKQIDDGGSLDARAQPCPTPVYCRLIRYYEPELRGAVFLHSRGRIYLSVRKTMQTTCAAISKLLNTPRARPSGTGSPAHCNECPLLFLDATPQLSSFLRPPKASGGIDHNFYHVPAMCILVFSLYSVLKPRKLSAYFQDA
jgi:hypothetical protein